MIENSEGYASWEIAFIQTVGLFGLYFTFFPGLAMDRFGAIRVAIVGVAILVSGYLIMIGASFIDSKNSTGMSFCDSSPHLMPSD